MVSHATPPFHKLNFMVALMNSLNPISRLRLCQGFFVKKEFFLHMCCGQEWKGFNYIFITLLNNWNNIIKFKYSKISNPKFFFRLLACF